MGAAVGGIGGVLVTSESPCICTRCAACHAEINFLRDEVARLREERDGYRNGQEQMQAGYSALWEHYMARIAECNALREEVVRIRAFANNRGRNADQAVSEMMGRLDRAVAERDEARGRWNTFVQSGARLPGSE